MAPLDTARLNETFELLTHQHRRYVLYYLTRESEVVSIDTLGTAIASWDEDHTGTGQTTKKEEILSDLYHKHLPKLADAGIITFGPNRDSIELGESDRVGRFLDNTAPIDGYTQAVAGD